MRAKRALDVVVGGLLLVATSPLWLVVTVVIKLTSPGPVLHRAVRVGKDARPFTILKFRTMRVAAGPGITSAADPRITGVGRVLRRFKVDELPQLVNVVRGDMSLVGPRPEDPRYVERYTDDQRRVLRMRPGLTSPATLAYRDEERLFDDGDVEQVYVERIMPRKLALDAQYVEAWSMSLDVRVIVRTIAALFVRPRRA